MPSHQYSLKNTLILIFKLILLTLLLLVCILILDHLTFTPPKDSGNQINNIEEIPNQGV